MILKSTLIIINFYLFLCLFAVSFAAKIPRCPINEEFNDCGTACQRNCRNRHLQIRCTAECVTGCFCKDGYIRAFPHGPCILERKCKDVPTCRENEELGECSDICPRTCQNNGIRGGCSHRIFCIKAPCLQPECLAECVCKSGYVREELGGECIPEETCEKKCNKNRTYTKCGTACPDTCSAQSRPCTDQCVPGCICNEGYLLDQRTNECVKAENCRRIHPVNITTT